MKNIFGISFLILSLSVVYYLIVYLPSQNQKVYEIESQKAQVEIQQKQEQMNYYNQRSETLKYCSQEGRMAAADHIKSLVFPQPIPDGNKLAAEYTDRCMRENGF